MKRVQLLLLAVLTLLLTTCQQGPEGSFLDESGAWLRAQPSWPPRPAEARVTYLAEISNSRGLASRRFWSGRAGESTVAEVDRSFVRPAALCVSGDLLAVADPGQGALHLLDLVERTWTTTTGTSEGTLASPVGVACLPDGRVVVSDSVRQALWVYDASGAPQGRFTDSELQRPTGLALDPSSARLWVTETLAHRLRRFDLSGQALDQFGARGGALGRFNYPTMIASDREGGLWVTDSLNSRLQHLDASGEADRFFGTVGGRAGAFARPRGLAIDRAGRIFVVDALFDAVQIFDGEGKLLMVFGERGIGPGQFWLPSDVALDEQERIYVADSYNQRIQIFTYRAPKAAE